MALVFHDDGSLQDICEDLKVFLKRLEEIRKDMKTNEITSVGFDAEKGQVAGRTAMDSFLRSGESYIRRAKDDKYLQSRLTSTGGGKRE